MTPRPVAVAILLLALPLAGCFGDEPLPAERTVTAGGGKASLGWSYDGSTVAPAAATLAGTLHNPDNTGNVTATFDLAGSAWTISMGTFTGSQAFMDGGVAFELNEHGDTGVADASIPRILARIAAWGTATVTRDGVVLTGASGGDQWTAHLMVSDTTVRGTDGKITKADGTTPYDPSAPGDARRVEGDPQAFLWVKSPDGEDAARPPVPLATNLTFTGPQATQTFDIPAQLGATSITINLTFGPPTTPAPAGPPSGVGDVVVTLVDATGNATGSATLATGGATTGTLTADRAAITGPMQLVAMGKGAFTLQVEGVIAYDDIPFIVLTWDDVTIA